MLKFLLVALLLIAICLIIWGVVSETHKIAKIAIGALMFFAFIGWGINKEMKYNAACEARGGVVLQSRGGFGPCMDPKVFK